MNGTARLRFFAWRFAPDRKTIILSAMLLCAAGAAAMVGARSTAHMLMVLAGLGVLGSALKAGVDLIDAGAGFLLAQWRSDDDIWWSGGMWLS